ncbi:Uncharacterized protein BP5553_07808 [Venustampulla echinocandica]|uniref:Glucose-methanol-choline oxidoreductase N-terminal domain-containing protein n=1 Tax=Venustampulla echinocandica TaxID=2656787 RepID=A0A370THM2_9HELO|nr:Uncharacterized protein BP5553_07808 [Venustampulla echinocandica]RDL34680.1 Uncharacterized protein BP5553_07808 [Venustampulla echinocandica]
MGVFSRIPSGLDEVDVIIAGGGTAGCVVASRLSDADPNLSILIIEGGSDNYNDPSIIHPLLFLSHLMPTSKNTLFYQGTKEPKLDNRELVVPSGGVLGGGSSINLLTYSRAQRQDLDSWKMPGWSANELLPFMKKLETYHGPGTSETHGADGPVQISNGTYHATTSENDFIQAATKIGWPEKVDIQNLDTSNATQRNLRFISPEGLRQDAAHTYLHPRLQDGKHKNLHVLVEHQVIRVLFENKKATGVEYQPNSAFHNGTPTVKTIKSNKLVVVSAGALGTPLVLERSGVGDPAILAKAGVDVVAEVPGVGRNYMDHHLLTYPYRSSLLPNETFDAVYGGRVDIGQLIATNNSILGWNAADVTSKLRPSDAEASTLGPAFLQAWNKDFKNVPNKPVSIITSLNGFPGDPTGLPVAQFMSTSTFTVYPYSRGHIHITGKDLSVPLDFQTGFFSDEQDVDIKKSIWSYKKQREILRRMDVYRGEYAPGHPPFSAGSDAACKEFDTPLKNVQDIVYTPEDDAILEQWVRQNVGSTWHSMGTCKMAPQSEFGVVDATLSVYGVNSLKLADLSIPPQNVAANTGNTAFVVGEKAADIFIKDLGL